MYEQLLSQEPAEFKRVQPMVDGIVKAVEDVKASGITHTNRNPAPEYGSWIASQLLGLNPRGSKVIKGAQLVDDEGCHYQVVTKVVKPLNRIPVIKITKKGRLDYLALVQLNYDLSFSKLQLISVDADLDVGQDFRFDPKDETPPEKVLTSGESRDLSRFDDVMKSYASAVWKLIEEGVVRSEGKAAADLGEFYASQYFDFDLEDRVNRPDFDAKDPDGSRIQIKSRLETPVGGGAFKDCFNTYTSFDFRDDRLLKEKIFDTLVGCFLDWRYRPIAFLTAPYEVVTRQIIERAADSGNRPSPRYRWNYGSFLDGGYSGAELFITQLHAARYEALEQRPNVHLTLF